MKPSLFQPKQFTIPPSLILIPYFPVTDLIANMQRLSLHRYNFLRSNLLCLKKTAVLSGFIGYPHLLMLLEFIADLKEKEIYFLGSAGALQPGFLEPTVIQVSKIYSSSIFKRFSRKNNFQLKVFPESDFPCSHGVSVDLIQRETASWLAVQQMQNIAIVEMELFPLRWFLQKPFHAMVVLSDMVENSGIHPFEDKQKFQLQFERAFNYIINYINHC